MLLSGLKSQKTQRKNQKLQERVFKYMVTILGVQLYNFKLINSLMLRL